MQLIFPNLFHWKNFLLYLLCSYLKGRPLANIDEPKCQECMFKDSLCLDYNNDGLTEECWCPRNENCQRSPPAVKQFSAVLYEQQKKDDKNISLL